MIALVDQPFTCVHCKKSFMQEKTAMVHMCERKRRALQQSEKRVQAGYLAFNKFWQLTQNAKKLKTYDEFADSSFYNAFVKFGSFVNNVKPLYPEKFIDFVIKSGTKLDHWCRDELYEKYLFDTLKVEPVDAAIQRSLQTMIEWADENKTNFSDYFDTVNLNKAAYDIVNGKISCWIILNSNSGKGMIQKMNDDQLAIIAPAFDIKFWLRKFKEHPADVLLVKEICKEANIN